VELQKPDANSDETSQSISEVAGEEDTSAQNLIATLQQ
jgi:hypothetical protein